MKHRQSNQRQHDTTPSFTHDRDSLRDSTDILSLHRQVNAHDEDDEIAHPDSRTSPPTRRPNHAAAASATHAPSSPPPSFHSRASSTGPRNRHVNDPALADAFDADDSDSDDEPDDRQRLVRHNSEPASPGGSSTLNTPPEPARANASATNANAPAAAASGMRVFGSGIQNDGIFSNLTAKPERGGSEKEEQPPVCSFVTCTRPPPPFLSLPDSPHRPFVICRTACVVHRVSYSNMFDFCRRPTNKPLPMLHLPTGKRPS